MLPPHRSARGLTAQFEIVQRGAQFEQGGALAAGQFEGGGDVAGAGVEVHYRLDRTLAPREGFVNDSLITTLPAIRNRIRELRRHAARSLAESSTRQAFANAKVEIEGLAAQLDKGQALDLRWTIIGLFISAGGAWLSYWM